MSPPTQVAGRYVIERRLGAGGMSTVFKANDAVLEADHFVDISQLEPGDLVPVLDIERNEDQMSQAEMTRWILTWLDRVTERVGVRPMVYTSPHGWATRTGDTTAVADAGYLLLWVAHWNVASPTVPGANWSGNGWTFWHLEHEGEVKPLDAIRQLYLLATEP